MESQEDIQLRTIPFDWQLKLTGADHELGLLAVPYGKNHQVEILSIGYTCRVAVTTCTVRSEWRDALLTDKDTLTTAVGAFLPTNVTPDRVLDCDSTSAAEVADVLGTLIADLKAGLPIPAYTITNLTRDVTAVNTDSGTLGLLADQVGQLINDIYEGRIVEVAWTPVNADRVFDADSTSVGELFDIVQTLHTDLTPQTYLHAAANVVNQGLEGYVSLWNGSLVLNQGDVLNLQITDSNVSTPGEGYAAIVEHRVLRRS